MRTLADLFDDRTPVDTVSTHDHDRERARFAEVVGPPRTAARRGVPADDTSTLIAMVDQATRTVSPTRVAGSASTGVASKRGTKRIDWINVSAAVVAVVVVIAVSAFAAIQFVNSDPAESAVRSLSADEASLANAEAVAGASITRINEQIDEARSQVDAVLPALRTVKDYVDEASFERASDAVIDLRTALDEVDVPEAPVMYQRPEIDTGDLGAVGAQIDAVRERSGALPALNERIRAARESVVGAQEAFATAMRELGSTFPAAADAEVAENIEAEAVFVDAVQDGAAAVVAAQESGQLAVREMAAYPALVDALREDHARAIAEILAERERLAEIERQNDLDNGGGFAPAPSDPGTGNEAEPEPTQPVDPVDPVEPEPTEPAEPVDPGSEEGAAG